MGSCGDSADGWEGTQEETLRRHGRRRGIICNVATLGWAALAWWHLTSEAAGHRTGSRQRASAQCCLLLCVSVLCCVVFIVVLCAAAACWRSVEAEHGGSLARAVAAARPGLVPTPPTPAATHQLPAAAAATPPAGGRHAPSCGQVGGRLLGGECEEAGGVRDCACGVSIDQAPQQATTCCCMVMSSVQCSVQSPVCACLQPDMGPWAGAGCSAVWAGQQIIGWLIHFPSSNKLTNFALFPNLTTFYFYYETQLGNSRYKQIRFTDLAASLAKKLVLI